MIMLRLSKAEQLHDKCDTQHTLYWRIGEVGTAILKNLSYLIRWAFRSFCVLRPPPRAKACQGVVAWGGNRQSNWLEMNSVNGLI